MKNKMNRMFSLCLILTFGFVAVPLQAFDEKPIRVYVDITGDLFHSGHVEFLKKAKSLGDVLIVGVLPDETVASYKRQPILSLEERVIAIAACKLVDEIIPGCPLRLTEEMIDELEIDLVVHGDDFKDDMQSDHYAVPLRLGIFRTVPYTEGISTTEIIERIKNRYDLKEYDHTACE